MTDDLAGIHLPADQLMRVQPLKPMSRAETVVCDLLALGMTYVAIAVQLRISVHTVHDYSKRAASKIPGDLPRQLKCIAWARGATEDVLTGRMHRAYIVELTGRQAFDKPPRRTTFTMIRRPSPR